MKRSPLMLLLLLASCGGGDRLATSPDTPPAAGAPAAVSTPAPVRDSWTEQGVTVTILSDEWGPGSCHTRAGTRRLRIDNRSSVTVYSRRASYGSTTKGCGATQEQVGGKPTMLGPESIAPGQSGEVAYVVTMPDCARQQVDDSWYPGIFVVGDVFNSDVLCPTPPPCVEKWVELPPVVTESEWSACAKAAQGCAKTKTVRTVIKERNSCTSAERVKSDKTTTESAACECPCSWEGSFVIDYLSNSGNGYVIKDDGINWKTGLNLSSGRRGYAYAHAIDGSNLCLWWGSERIDCAAASCPEVGASWHGDVHFECSCR